MSGIRAGVPSRRKAKARPEPSGPKHGVYVYATGHQRLWCGGAANGVAIARRPEDLTCSGCIEVRQAREDEPCGSS